jgi:hypothetical protein
MINEIGRGHLAVGTWSVNAFGKEKHEISGGFKTIKVGFDG